MLTSLLKKVTHNDRSAAAGAFIIKVLLVYLLWKIFFYWATTPGTLLHGSWIEFTDWYAAVTIRPAAWVLKNLLGYDLIFNKRNIFITNTPGYYVANHCLGIPPAVIFSGFILSYPGRGIHKLWYILFGVFCIYAINVVRLVALGITEACCYQVFFELAHTWVYLLLSYGMFFLLVVFWMNVLSRK